MFGIYIHWPYCLSKCPYCDFFSQVDKNISQEQIIDSYLKDLDFYYDMTSKKAVTSIFFGGGTPSLLKPQNIEKVINHINKKWQMASNIEISLEANPNTQTKTLFMDLKSAGINRLSLGVQALNDEDLKFLGRTHSYQEAKYAINEVLKNFNNHSMDLIYARPNQCIDNWQKELLLAKSFGFKHLSLYQLTIEEKTPFYKQNVEAMEEESAAQMYIMTQNLLSDKYKKYEVSNYALPNYEAQHNLTYWRGYDYLGIGASAEGRIGFKATNHQRQIEKLSKEERATELLLMGLRIAEGINKKRFFEQCQINFEDFINQKNLIILEAEKLIENTKSTCKVSEKGFLLLNEIIAKLCD